MVPSQNLPRRIVPPGFKATVERLLLGPAPGERLPARARAAVRESHEEAEILVCWLQLVALALFALLYALSSKDFAVSGRLDPAPYAFALYAVFTALRLSLAYRRRLSDAFLSASVIVDVSVLMITIWSFHIQYQEPPGIYLKAPTLFYLFIMIALRALRLEPRFILLTGAAGILGWLALVGYVAAQDATLTTSYVRYLTSFDLHIEAELDKLVAIAATTLVLAVAVARARRLLARTAVEEAAAQELSRFVGADVAQRIRGADEALGAGEGEMREAAILFIDMRGFTRATASLTPNETIALLKSYQAHLVPRITAAGGVVDKFLGDGILVSFGAAREQPSYAADALRAAEAVLEEGQRWTRGLMEAGKPAPAVALALAVGPVIFGTVGFADRLEYTVIGDAVNLAAKLEKHAKAVGARGLITGEAYHRALAQGGRAPAAPIFLQGERVEGVADPLDLVIIA